MKHRFATFHLSWLLAVFAAAFGYAVHAGGTAPTLWTDTIMDQFLVDDCLLRDRCALVGPGTSVGEIYVGLTWIDLRVLMKALGIGWSGALLACHVFFGLSATLAAAAAHRLGTLGPGRPGGYAAGSFAAVLMFYLVARFYLGLDVLYNNHMLVLLGAAYTGLLLASAPTLPGIALAAALAAMIANGHTIGGLLVLPTAALAWAHPRRLRALAAGLGTMAATAFVLAPETWIINVRTLVGGYRPTATQAGAFEPFPIEWMALSALAGLVLIARAAGRGSPERDRAVRLLALVGPPIAVVMGARFLGAVDSTTEKYLTIWFVPVVVAAAWVLAAGLRQLSAWLPVDRPGGIGASARVARAALPWVVAALALDPTDPHLFAQRRVGPGLLPGITLDDLSGVRDALQRRGWDTEDLPGRLQGPEAWTMMDFLFAREEDRPAAAPAGGPDTLLVLKVRPRDLPAPEGWETLPPDRDGQVVLASYDTWIDWDGLEACLDPPGPAGPECGPVGWRRAPDDDRRPGANNLRVSGLPPPGHGIGHRLQVRFPIRAEGDAPHRVHMPRLARACRGRVVAAPEGSRIRDDGREADLVPPPGGVGELVVEWALGGPECPRWGFLGWVPFFLEGPEAVVGPAADLLARAGEP